MLTPTNQRITPMSDFALHQIAPIYPWVGAPLRCELGIHGLAEENHRDTASPGPGAKPIPSIVPARLTGITLQCAPKGMGASCFESNPIILLIGFGHIHLVQRHYFTNSKGMVINNEFGYGETAKVARTNIIRSDCPICQCWRG